MIGVAAFAAAFLALLALLVALRRGPDSGAEERLAALQARLDRLVEVQQAIPRALAEGTADQVRSLADVRERLAQLNEATRRLEALGEAVTDVRRLLRVPQLRGTLGEIWLEELLRQVLPAQCYEIQYGFRSGERVDAVIRLRDRLVPVDAKFPLEACQRMLELEGEAAERERRSFRRSLRARIDEIADKYIRPDEGTYEFALMYVPAETVYYEAVVRDASADGDSVSAYAHQRRVIPVSPHTFYAYLSALVHGLRGLEVEERAQEILDALGGLDQETGRLREAVELVGRHLQNAVKQQHEAERRLDGVRGRLEGMRTLAPAEVDVP